MSFFLTCFLLVPKAPFFPSQPPLSKANPLKPAAFFPPLRYNIRTALPSFCVKFFCLSQFTFINQHPRLIDLTPLFSSATVQPPLKDSSLLLAVQRAPHPFNPPLARFYKNPIEGFLEFSGDHPLSSCSPTHLLLDLSLITQSELSPYPAESRRCVAPFSLSPSFLKVFSDQAKAVGYPSPIPVFAESNSFFFRTLFRKLACSLLMKGSRIPRGSPFFLPR